MTPRRDLAVVTAVAFLLGSAAAVGCSRRSEKSATGAGDEVMLVVGEGVPVSAAALLERALAPAHSERIEPAVRVVRVTADRFDGVRSHACLVVLVNLGVSGPVTRAARDAMSSQQVIDGSSGTTFYAQRDTWAAGQSVLFLPGGDAQQVLRLVENRTSKIRDAVVEAVRERIGNALFRDGDDRSASEALAGAVGWTLRVPESGWEIDRSLAEEGLVRVSARGPDRALSIRWLPADSTRMNPEGAFALLDEIGEPAAPGETVDRAKSTVSGGAFLGHAATQITGEWSRADGGVSGPLASTLFIDPGTSRLYVIDRRVYSGVSSDAIGIWELDAIAATLRLAPPGHDGSP